MRHTACDRKIGALQDLIPLLEQVAKRTTAAGGRRGRRRRGAGHADRQPYPRRLKGCAVKAPGFGDRRKAMLQDIAILTGAQVISEELGLKLENVAIEQLGRAKRVVVDKDNTTSSAVPASASRSSAGRADPPRDREDDQRLRQEKLQERLAKLAGGVAVIRVGAPTEAEMKSKKEALDDAISATKAAVAEGIVPGGGLALLRCIEAVAEGRRDRRRRADRRSDPEARARSAGAADRRESAVDGGVVVRPRMLDSQGNFGFEPRGKEYVDLVEAGIIDPAKVVRIALENAVSVASILLLTEATMTEIPETEEEEGRPSRKWECSFSPSHTGRKI